ncbi:glycosyltransferase [Sphingomonas sp. LR55]|uniref:glycosyltransferase n=1 Tax=Sphingomonas sp. LR55 TaxID=3050231 RepID=UPI002FDFB2D7
MEALALGRPVLASNVAAMADLVVNGETGWLFSPGSVDAVTRAMADCIATPVETCTAMGERGRALIRDRHDASREARKIYDLMTAHKMGHKMERRA